MTDVEIKTITDELYIPCLYGGLHVKEQDIQQYVCKAFNSENCTCYVKYKSYLDQKITNLTTQ